jgi:hypothetical protein
MKVVIAQSAYGRLGLDGRSSILGKTKFLLLHTFHDFSHTMDTGDISLE